MEYRRLGKSGLKVSELSFGSWVTFHNQAGYDSAKDMMILAYEAGVNFFDNAEAYAEGQSEIIMGKALRDLGWTRDSYIVSSKVFWGGEKPTQRGLSRKHVRDACDAALKRLQLDYLDLYFCHRPDVDTPIEETVRAMHDLVSQGKILYWGTSEWSAQEIFEAHGIARQIGLTPPTMEQPEYNLFNRDKMEHDYLRAFSELGLGTTIWSPLASGLLTGKYNSEIPKDSRANLKGYEWLKNRFDSPEGQLKIQKTRALEALAKEAGLSLTHLSLLWCLHNPNVSTVILGASRKEQLVDNLAALKDRKNFDAGLADAIEGIVKNKPAAWPRY
ncbi:MAG: aldo/keto reductase [Chitinophagaceae bacterium]|nr:aldo/keto reductase [Oligoflexus sp.]